MNTAIGALLLICTLSAMWLSLLSRLDKIEHMIEMDRRVYNVEARYVLINPCDLWDVSVKTQIERNIK